MNRPFPFAEAGAFIAEHLMRSKKISLVALREDFTIADHNAGFSECLGRRDELTGKKLQEILMPESRYLLTELIADQTMPLRLNFLNENGDCVSIDCFLTRTATGYLIFADHALHEDNDVLRTMTTLSNQLAAMTRDLNRKNRALQKAREQIKVLSGVVPICMYCKEIRDDRGYWNRLEQFIEEHSEAQFSHSICDKCLEKKYGES